MPYRRALANLKKKKNNNSPVCSRGLTLEHIFLNVRLSFSNVSLPALQAS